MLFKILMGQMCSAHKGYENISKPSVGEMK
jgi:hypothetical protein